MNQVPAAVSNVLAPVGQNRDLLLVAAIIGILFAIVMPMPASFMDVCLIFNITLALLILLTTIYVREPLEFSVFPSLLLVTTLYRLALNIATTRLILGEAGMAGERAAGGVIQVFGNFVTGNNVIVGFIIFVVIVVIQFVVITKGATRIAEVAARFTLDKMPGQQLSIDADLNAGLIDEKTAKERRERINQEADFYGAMDGASKFVRGDAIAGIIITLINILGGLILGMTKYGFTFDEAVKTFTVLTIGDGLVSQIPALIISIAAGLIVTRTNTVSNLGSDLVTQVFSNPRAIYIVGAFLLLLLPSRLPPLVLIPVAALCGATAFFMTRARAEGEVEQSEHEEEKKPFRPPNEIVLPPVDPLEIEVGYGLVNLVEPEDGRGLLQRVGVIREQLAAELGVVVPPVRIRDNTQLRPDEYTIKLRGDAIGSGRVAIDHYLATDPGLGLEPLEGIKTKEHAFGLDAVWVSAEHRGRAEAQGYTVVDVTSVVATHLAESIRNHVAELLTREELNRLLERLKEDSPAVVGEVVGDALKLGEVQKVLQSLLREKVPIRDLEAILECLGDWSPRTKDTEVLTEYVRQALGRVICRQYLGPDDRLHVVTLDPRIEDYIQNATEHNERGSFLRLNPEMLGPIVQVISKALEGLVAGRKPPVVLTAPQVRLQVRRMMENTVPGVVVLSYNEVVRGISVESAGLAQLD